MKCLFFFFVDRLVFITAVCRIAVEREPLLRLWVGKRKPHEEQFDSPCLAIFTLSPKKVCSCRAAMSLWWVQPKRGTTPPCARTQGASPSSSTAALPAVICYYCFFVFVGKCCDFPPAFKPPLKGPLYPRINPPHALLHQRLFERTPARDFGSRCACVFVFLFSRSRLRVPPGLPREKEKRVPPALDLPPASLSSPRSLQCGYVQQHGRQTCSICGGYWMKCHPLSTHPPFPRVCVGKAPLFFSSEKLPIVLLCHRPILLRVHSPFSLPL